MSSATIATRGAGLGAALTRLRRSGPELLIDWGVYAALAGAFVFFAFTAPEFLTGRNFQAIGNSVAVIGILAVPFTIALVAGQIDLTIGIMIGLLSAVFEVVVVRGGHSVIVGLVVMLLVGLLVGLINGAIVVNFGVNSIVATFAMLQVVFGASYTLWKFHRTNAESSGEFTSTLSPGDRGFSFVRLANSHVLGIPMPVVILAIVALLGYLFLSRSKLGWHVYATGGNRSAALRSGIRVDGIVRLVFLLTPIAGLLAAVITMGRTGQADPGTGYGYEFDVLTAVLIGGIGFEGGIGKVERSLAGALFVVMLKDGLSLRNVDSSKQYMAEAIALILAVVLAAVGAKRRKR
jgi:ribose/xylose/arabinose/galactoside ABC-type transport system permease subunit